jgi:hypothetical protein
LLFFATPKKLSKLQSPIVDLEQRQAEMEPTIADYSLAKVSTTNLVRLFFANGSLQKVTHVLTKLTRNRCECAYAVAVTTQTLVYFSPLSSKVIACVLPFTKPPFEHGGFNVLA